MTGAATPGPPDGGGGTPLYSDTSSAFLIRGATVVRPRSNRIEAADVLLRGGRVEAVEPDLGGAGGGVREIDARGRWLLPGWIDLQLNDFEGVAQVDRSPRTIAERVREVLRYQASRGVTGLVLATVALPLDTLVRYLEGMASILEAPGDPLDGVFLGALVEGAFMNPAHCGAHNPAWVLPQESRVLDRLLGTGAVRFLNVAPEMSAGALDLIRRAAGRGVVVGVGHARPHAERLREAVAAGLRYAIHLGNGPTGSSLKVFHDGGMLEEALRNDDLTVTVILDGYHIHPQLARDWISRKGTANVIAVSDGAFATGAPRDTFEVMGVPGRVAGNGEYLELVPSAKGGPDRRAAAADAVPAECPELSTGSGALFGSAVGMRRIFENALNLLGTEMPGVYHRLHPALDDEEALLAAARLTSLNPALLAGLEDRGSIEPGERADVVMVDIRTEAGARRVGVHGTWIGRNAPEST